MKYFEFFDYETIKYKYIERFSCGLAAVQNQQGLWGFINKKGEEVIPCIYSVVLAFSEDLAAVQDANGKGGFIDKKGNEVIPCTYNAVSPFKEGLAAYKDDNDLWGFIDKNQNKVIPAEYTEVNCFINGFAICKTSECYYGYVDKEGKFHGCFEWAHPFNGDTASVREFAGDRKVYTIDKNFKKKSDLLLAGKQLYDENCGLSRFINNENLQGYVDSRLKIKIPCVFHSARGFKDDMAIVELTPAIIGFINKEGKNISFSKQLQYNKIHDFSCGLAAVQNPQGLWGYINKEGKEVIPCKYIKADDFSENLAGVLDSEGHLLYIDKRGTRKITIPLCYHSILHLEDKDIYISSFDKQELSEKKRITLNIAKEEIMQAIQSEASVLTSDIEQEIYQLRKKQVS